MSEPTEFIDLPVMHPPSGNGDQWTVMEDWVSPSLHGRRVSIRAGFKTDGASIPRIAWRVIGHPMQVPLLGPALCHDALYAAELVKNHSTADMMLLEWAKKSGIGWAERNTVWSAVRLFGWIVWNRHTPESIAAARQYCQLLRANTTTVIWPENQKATTP